MIRFLAEISRRFDTAVLPTPSNEHANTAINGTGIIYEIDIDEHPTESYWLNWDGYYNNFAGTQLRLYYDGLLTRVGSLNELRKTASSLFIDGRKVLINLPRHPWLYPTHSTSVMEMVPFLSSALNPDHPSNNVVRKGDAEVRQYRIEASIGSQPQQGRNVIASSFMEGEDMAFETVIPQFAFHDYLHNPFNMVGEVDAQVRLEVPSFTVKLSDNISGMTLHQGFSITLHNDDGYFDDEDKWNMFNTPVYLKKAVNENPRYEDFKLFRDGLVENKKTKFDKVQIDVADRFKALEEPVCGVIRREDFGFAPKPNALGSQVPIVFGRARIRLTQLDGTRYMTAENATEVNAVYDRDGAIIMGTTFNAATKILTVPDADVNADEAFIVGSTGKGIDGNRIGYIIQTLTARANIPFTNSNFNSREFIGYADESPRINIVFTGGSIRGAIEAVLENDMAFFIQQADGRFTIRRYGNTYATHTISPWTITKKPEKDYGKAQDNYFSSCIINFVDDHAVNRSVLFDERENEAEKKYRRKVMETFDTYLTNEEDAQRLARLLSDRYTSMRQTVKLAVGTDTTEFELLDRVTVDLTINGRKFSNAANFIIKEINHAQDILVLEEI